MFLLRIMLWNWPTLTIWAPPVLFEEKCDLYSQVGTAPSGPAPQSWELPASQPLCKWLGLILGLNTWPVPSRPPKKGLVVERPNVCGLAATISPCWMKWKSCVVIGCSFCSVFYLKPQGCIFMLALWKCHLCFSSSVWLMHFLLPDVTLTCISLSTISKLNKGHLNPLWKFPSLWKVVDNNLNTPVL